MSNKWKAPFEYDDLVAKINDENTPVFIEVIDGVKKGTIARVTDVSKPTYEYGYVNGRYLPSYGLGADCELRLKVEGKREFSYKISWCKFLDGTNHTTVYKNDIANAPRTNDVFGNVIDIGTTVAFAWDDKMCVGVVSRITEKGGVFVKCLRVGHQKTKNKEHRIPYANIGTYVITDDARDQLMLAKLIEV
jgi:hypothetical protein